MSRGIKGIYLDREQVNSSGKPYSKASSSELEGRLLSKYNLPSNVKDYNLDQVFNLVYVLGLEGVQSPHMDYLHEIVAEQGYTWRKHTSPPLSPGTSLLIDAYVRASELADNYSKGATE